LAAGKQYRTNSAAPNLHRRTAGYDQCLSTAGLFARLTRLKKALLHEAARHIEDSRLNRAGGQAAQI
jgi:hypothetical protein